MKKATLFMVFVLCSYFSFCQTPNKADFNFGFEKINYTDRFSNNWFKWGTASYSLKVDHVEKHSGSASMLIEPVGPRDEHSFGCVAYSIPSIYEGHKKEIESDTSANNSAKNLNSLKTEDSVIIEKTYLHTDRDSYYPGDDIWFKAYLIDASDRLLSNHSNNLHVELISPALEIIDSRVVRINEGLGNGDFHVPKNLKSGRYRLRAYTNYMRNFSDQSFFNKYITIINTTDAAKAFSDSTNYIKNKLEISFFPEGGSLVDSVPCNVGFKALNALGIGCNVSGDVYSSKGEAVASFKSTHKGMGTFFLNPLPGLNYYVIVKNSDGDMVKSEIPKSFSIGIVLNISKNQTHELSVTFKTNTQTLSFVRDRDLSLIVSARNIPFKTYSFRMNSLNSFLHIPTDDLPEGIAMLTLLGLDNVPLCERLVYIQANEDVKINLETDKAVYNQRDSVSVKISLLVNSRIPQDAFLSLSSTKNISEESSSSFPSTISSWFLLESDVHGPVEEPSYYFDQSNPDRLKDLDLLLLTQGWRDFEWKYKNVNYQPENGFTISGRLRKKFADVPLKNSKVNIAIFKSGNPIIRIVPTDTSGRFCLEGVDLTGNAKLIVSGTGENERLKGLLILDSLSYSAAGVQGNISLTKLLPGDNQSKKDDQPLGDNQFKKENLKAFLQYAVINNSVRKKYRLSDTIPLGEVKIIAKRLDNPESARARSERYLMALSPDTEYEVTPQSSMFNNTGQLISFVLHMNAGNLSGLAFNGPLVLLDGMEVGWEGIASLPVDWIERFDGLRPGSAAAAAWGERGKGGVISVITRTGAPLRTKNYVYHSANIRISGYNESRVFYSPKHHTTFESDFKPDLRTTLFWEPNIKVENNKDFFVNYFNADNSSKIKVIVEGITSAGIPVTGKVEYEVR